MIQKSDYYGTFETPVTCAGYPELTLLDLLF